MDGIEVLAKLHGLGIAVPTVLMSANAHDLSARASQNGFVAALPKPFSMAEAYALVDRFAASRAGAAPRANSSPDKPIS
jgi:CheY-like chemotaxis protein